MRMRDRSFEVVGLCSWWVLHRSCASDRSCTYDLWLRFVDQGLGSYKIPWGSMCGGDLEM